MTVCCVLGPATPTVEEAPSCHGMAAGKTMGVRRDAHAGMHAKTPTSASDSDSQSQGSCCSGSIVQHVTVKEPLELTAPATIVVASLVLTEPAIPLQPTLGIGGPEQHGHGPPLYLTHLSLRL